MRKKGKPIVGDIVVSLIDFKGYEFFNGAIMQCVWFYRNHNKYFIIDEYSNDYGKQFVVYLMVVKENGEYVQGDWRYDAPAILFMKSSKFGLFSDD